MIDLTQLEVMVLELEHVGDHDAAIEHANSVAEAAVAFIESQLADDEPTPEQLRALAEAARLTKEVYRMVSARLDVADSRAAVLSTVAEYWAQREASAEREAVVVADRSEMLIPARHERRSALESAGKGAGLRDLTSADTGFNIGQPARQGAGDERRTNTRRASASQSGTGSRDRPGDVEYPIDSRYGRTRRDPRAGDDVKSRVGGFAGSGPKPVKDAEQGESTIRAALYGDSSKGKRTEEEDG